VNKAFGEESLAKKDDKFQEGGVLTAEALNEAMEKMMIQSARQMGKSEIYMSQAMYQGLKNLLEEQPVSRWTMEELEASDRDDAKKELKKRKSLLWKAING
jgi:hypothetical protein